MIAPHDRARISAAIHAAERTTDGEIFCVIARRASDYRLVPLTWAGAIALLAPLPLLLWTQARSDDIYLAQLLTFVLCAAVLSLPGLRTRIVPRRTRHERAHAAAMCQFLAQGIDRTPHRTGVLIFASAAERYVEILADSAINDKVAPGIWEDAIAVLVTALRAERPADGFIAAITQCATVLAIHFPPGTLNRDELHDRVLEI